MNAIRINSTFFFFFFYARLRCLYAMKCIDAFNARPFQTPRLPCCLQYRHAVIDATDVSRCRFSLLRRRFRCAVLYVPPCRLLFAIFLFSPLMLLIRHYGCRLFSLLRCAYDYCYYAIAALAMHAMPPLRFSDAAYFAARLAYALRLRYYY